MRSPSGAHRTRRCFGLEIAQPAMMFVLTTRVWHELIDGRTWSVEVKGADNQRLLTWRGSPWNHVRWCSAHVDRRAATLRNLGHVGPA